MSFVRPDLFFTALSSSVCRALSPAAPKEPVDGAQQAKVLDCNQNDRARKERGWQGSVRQGSEQKSVANDEQCRNYR